MNNYKLQSKSIWRFEDRGSWATHKGDYRGNWTPHVPRNLILRYSQVGDYVLDPFVGSGTTLIECKILDRNGIGLDINKKALEKTSLRLNFSCNTESKQFLVNGDARDMTAIRDESIDLICAHPPYHNIIKYSDGIKGDMSLQDYESFLHSFNQFSVECLRVLKPGKYMTFMIGDVRRNGKITPLGFQCLDIFRGNGFVLIDLIIKEQFNCSKTSHWENILSKRNLHLINHEYIFILLKSDSSYLR